MVASVLNIKKSDYTVISGLVKKNIVIILSLFTFAVISYDLTNESITEDTEIEFCNALTMNEANPSKPQADPSISKTKDKSISSLHTIESEFYVSEVTIALPKQPPLLCILI